MKYDVRRLRQSLGLRWLVFLLLLGLLVVAGGRAPSDVHFAPSQAVWGGVAWAQPPPAPDIQWFKNEMRIAPKYQEPTEGLWGLSWAHVILMIFLVVFFVATLVAMYARYKRTKEILKSLLKED